MPRKHNELPIDMLRRMLRYEPETGKIFWLVSRKGHVRAGMEAGSRHGKGYVSIGIAGYQYLAHRIAWSFVHGDPGPAAQIDHINGVRDDNRIANLRAATHAENSQNSKPRTHNLCGIKGVRKIRNKWHARIKVEKKEIWLGSFDTAEEAKAAYGEAASKHFGNFAKW